MCAHNSLAGSISILFLTTTTSLGLFFIIGSFFFVCFAGLRLVACTVALFVKRATVQLPASLFVVDFSPVPSTRTGGKEPQYLPCRSQSVESQPQHTRRSLSASVCLLFVRSSGEQAVCALTPVPSSRRERGAASARVCSARPLLPALPSRPFSLAPSPLARAITHAQTHTHTLSPFSPPSFLCSWWRSLWGLILGS